MKYLGKADRRVLGGEHVANTVALLLTLRSQQRNRRGHKVSAISPCLCHLLATVENGLVASRPQDSSLQPPTIRLVTAILMRCAMLSVNDDTFTMIGCLIVIAVGCIAGLLALG